MGEMASHTIYESIAHKNFIMDMCKVLINCLAPVLTKEVPELEWVMARISFYVTYKWQCTYIYICLIKLISIPGWVVSLFVCTCMCLLVYAFVCGMCVCVHVPVCLCVCVCVRVCVFIKGEITISCFCTMLKLWESPKLYFAKLMYPKFMWNSQKFHFE